MVRIKWALIIDKEYVTIRYCPWKKFLWSEWRGVIPSKSLRKDMLFAAEFIYENNVEYVLADYSRLSAPLFEDQIWISNHSLQLLLHSNLKRVANIIGYDLYEQIAIDSIYEMTAVQSLSYSSKEFITKDEALNWLLVEKQVA